MKKILLLCFLFALAIGNTQPFKKSDSLIFIDTDNHYLINTGIPEKKDFVVSKKAKYYLLNKPIWSYFTIQNSTSSEQKLIVYNSLRFLRFADILIVHEDQTKETFLIGSNRKNDFSSLGTIGYPLTLKPHETVEIYTRHNSIGPISTHWNVADTYQYYSERASESTFHGITIGIVILLIIYAMMMFYISREKSNLLFAGFIFNRLMFFWAFSGFFYTYNYGLGVFFRECINIFGPMALLLEGLFLISLYNLKQKSPLFYRLFSLSIALSTLILIIAVYSALTVFSILFIKIIMSYVVVFTLLVLTFALYAVRQKWTGSKSLLMSVLMYIFIRYSYVTFLDQSNLFYLIPMSAGIIEILLIQAALSFKVKELYNEKIKAQRIILDHAKYLSIGKMHAATIHQLKTPIARIGAIITRIRSIFELHKKELTSEEYASSNELEKIVTMANNTLTDLYNLYSTDQEKEHFDLKEAINETLILINTLSREHAISVHLSLIPAPLFNYPNSLKHIFIIILENSIDILIERNIKNPAINISLTKNETHYTIAFCDNGGGIMVQPVEDIFEFYKSYKKTKGLGLGLALAKDLANFTNAQIIVTNHKDGACFTLEIPFENPKLE